MPILHLFPEGCTTNGTKLIKFKRGAFGSLRAVRPVALTYNTPSWGISITQDVVGFLKHSLVGIMVGYCIANIDILPVFEPNDYFWKNYWQEGKEEKWEAFARANREILSEHLGIGLSDSKMEDKFVYKNELKAAHKQRKAN